MSKFICSELVLGHSCDQLVKESEARLLVRIQAVCLVELEKPTYQNDLVSLLRGQTMLGTC